MRTSALQLRTPVLTVIFVGVSVGILAGVLSGVFFARVWTILVLHIVVTGGAAATTGGAIIAPKVMWSPQHPSRPPSSSMLSSAASLSLGFFFVPLPKDGANVGTKPTRVYVIILFPPFEGTFTYLYSLAYKGSYNDIPSYLALLRWLTSGPR